MKYITKCLVITLLTSILISCGHKVANEGMMLFDKKDFTAIVDDQQVSLYTLDSGSGLTMQVTNYGARIVSLWVPDRDGKHEDVVFGFDSIDKYINTKSERFLGPTVGRYANRIANAEFALDGVTYKLNPNDKSNTLHGGLKGFDSYAWDVVNADENSITMSILSKDGDEGFPGNLSVLITYKLTPENELVISYEAKTDKPTHVNLTNHSQFNLKGAGNGTILDHLLTINSNSITPVDSLLIPTGDFQLVENTPFDFRNGISIGQRIEENHPQLLLGKGYDHNWVANRETADQVEFMASVYEPNSGRFMEVFSDQPGIQIYTANFFTGEVMGKYNKPLLHRGAIALEVQKYPNTPNQPNFPTSRLNPYEVYKQTCIYKFSVK